MSRASFYDWLRRWSFRRVMPTLFEALTLMCGVAALLTDSARAQDQARPDSRWEAQIEAGEFAPAVRAAASMPRGNKRDASFARLAAAQAAAGAATSAYLSASQVDSDALR
jgi:hypothetical protein